MDLNPEVQYLTRPYLEVDVSCSSLVVQIGLSIEELDLIAALNLRPL